MRKLLIITWLLAATHCFANDAPIAFLSGNSGTARLVREKRVRLASEVIRIRLHSYESLDDLRFQADFDCELLFVNMTEEDITLDVGFPVGYGFANEIVDYSVFANGVEIPCAQASDLEIGGESYSSVFISPVTFSPGRVCTLRHIYTMASRDFAAPDMVIDYVFSTGRSWGGKTAACDVLIDIDEKLLPFLWSFAPRGMEVVDKTRLEWHFDGLPKEELYLEFVDDVYPPPSYYFELSEEDYEKLPSEYGVTAFEELMDAPHTSDRLLDYVLFTLAKMVLPTDSTRAARLMKELAERTRFTDRMLLYRLSECLLANDRATEAGLYLRILADQKKASGLSIYGQLALREAGLSDAPLDTHFPEKQRWSEIRVGP